MSERVLHPTDFSKASAAAFARAMAEARQRRSELTVLHVLAPVISCPVLTVRGC
jgi:nucleotide-binding universal stress UspA family protein